MLRADDRLRRRQVAALRLREVPRDLGDALDAHEVGRRGDGDRAHLRPGVRQGAALARARQAAVPRGVGRGGAAREPRRTAAGALRDDPRAARARHLGRRDPRGDVDRPLVPARAARARARPRGPVRGPALVPLGRHLRGRVPGPHALLLLRLGRRGHGRHGGRRGRARGAGVGRDPRGGPEQDRAGDRVRLLLRARRDDGQGVRPRRRDGQLQPRDRLDRLRHLRPPLLRAADARRTCSPSSKPSAPAGAWAA